ncbi:MAG: hypothetical protein ABR527_05785 [Gemmatimonadota bacterium]
MSTPAGAQERPYQEAPDIYQEVPDIGASVGPRIAPGMPVTVAGITGYDGGGRRDPFIPLFGDATGGTSGPRFELLKLTGIFRGSSANSLVVLEDPSHRGHFVRLGQEIGSARLVEILPQGAVFEVRDYGASRRMVLRLERSQERP